MTAERVQLRPLRRDDLGRIVRLWEESGYVPTGPDGLGVDESVDAALDERVVSVVAERDGAVVGAASGAVVGALGILLRVAANAPPTLAVVERLLDDLEARMVEAGARRLVARTVPDAELTRWLTARGYTRPEGRMMLERALPPTMTGPTALSRLGGRMVDPGLWASLKGMEEAKSLIERRVILPLAEPGLAARHAVALPKAIVLFGPPGTGKTTFAMGIASRLEWPFVEVQPSEIAGEGRDREARRLADAFDLTLELASAVVFVDEVEDLASVRHAERRVGPSVTNEFLKQLPRLREAPYHLLVCATNWVGRLDAAFLRPGRFDYVIPVGPPDAAARASIWRRYVEEITDENVDVEALVAASEWFTPADIEHAAHKAAQTAFEREHFERVQRRATTVEFLAAIRDTRPSLDEQTIETFRSDAAAFARL